MGVGKRGSEVADLVLASFEGRFRVKNFAEGLQNMFMNRRSLAQVLRIRRSSAHLRLQGRTSCSEFSAGVLPPTVFAACSGTKSFIK